MQNVKKINWEELTAKAGILSVCLSILAISIGSPLYLGNKIDNLRSEMKSDFKEFRSEMNEFKDIWAKESRDFHGRLIAIETKNKEK